jgi:hypothetical protein
MSIIRQKYGVTLFDVKFEANGSLGASAATEFNEMFSGSQDVTVSGRFGE